MMSVLLFMSECDLRLLSLARKGDTDYDSVAVSTQIPLEPRQVDSLSRSGGDNKTNYSIMGIIPLFQAQTGVLDWPRNWLPDYNVAS